MIFFPPTWNFRDGLGAMVGLRLAYMTGEYPRVTDTFIQREVLALRALGHYVKTFSVRHPPDNESAGEDAAESRRTTIYLLPPRNLVGAHVAQFFRSPREAYPAVPGRSRYGMSSSVSRRPRRPRRDEPCQGSNAFAVSRGVPR